MQHQFKPIFGVPTNIITGFLGVGKTSTILHILNSKPKYERWAVLVNEFGEIGIDGALLEGKHCEENGVYIKEVPGGCMCCTAGLPMRVALAQLLRRAKPDRLLIEPTGLGHPKEVLQTLNDVDFKGVLDVQNILTLVDARHLSKKRYIENEAFQQQIAIADIVVANKQDLYTEKDKAALKTYMDKPPTDGAKLVFTEQGAIEPSLLEGSRAIVQASSALRSISETNHLHFNTPIPDCGYIKAVNEGEGFVSVGWRFSSRFEFDRTKLFSFLSGVYAERIKATFITDQGCFAYNFTRDTLSESSLEYVDESRVEIIADQLSDEWEQRIFSCLTK